MFSPSEPGSAQVLSKEPAYKKAKAGGKAVVYSHYFTFPNRYCQSEIPEGTRWRRGGLKPNSGNQDAISDA